MRQTPPAPAPFPDIANQTLEAQGNIERVPDAFGKLAVRVQVFVRVVVGVSVSVEAVDLLGMHLLGVHACETVYQRHVAMWVMPVSRFGVVGPASKPQLVVYAA